MLRHLETRSWATKHRGPLAIHAGQKVAKEACSIPQIREALLKYGINDWGGYMPDEYHFGDYSDGRFAWQLDDVVQLQEPVPAKGQLSLWNWEESG
ncbi:hypothetical protein [Paenibacillus sp. FSL R5-0519]|uniref:hypothetical protein n=1 Tax=Paenibacillus sp. FSL R5-0519 TaxID=2921648 RepID=UPI0030DBC3F1